MDDMVNKFKTFNIKTVRDIRLILELLDNKEDYKVYNSNFYLDYSEISDIYRFKPVTYISSEDNCVVYSWENVEAVSLNKFLEKLVLCKQDRGLERDIEDGYVYKDYENLIIRYDLKIIILL